MVFFMPGYAIYRVPHRKSRKTRITQLGKTIKVELNRNETRP